MPDATIYIGDWKSHCGHCNGNASPHEQTHTKYDGCGARFVNREPAPSARVYVDRDGNITPAYEAHDMDLPDLLEPEEL